VSDASFRHFVDRLKETVSIEDVVSARVPGMKRAGAEWKGCCPFHDERTASFYVVPAKGLYHCFGCGASGDVIGFVEAFDGVTFMEAVEELAASCGLEVPRRKSGASREDARRERLYDVLDRAARLYRKKLLGPEGEAARRYLEGRGLETAATEAFGLGWAPVDGRTLVQAARAAGIELSALVDAGLAKKPAQGEPFDFFRGRLIVPIRDARGRTIGFGGRVLPGTDGPKYLNTGETELFQKGQLVFGLDLAGETARHTRHLVLMEGYTDVIAAHQAGLRQAVAVLGTATTQHHARLLRRTGAQRLTLVFDGDAVGRAAAIKALRGLLPRGEFEAIDALALPDGQDPCDMLVERSGPGGTRGARFLALLEKPADWFDFLADGLDRRSPQALADAIDEVLGVLAVVPNPVEREARVRALAERAGLSPSSVEARFAVLAKGAAQGTRPAAPPREGAARAEGLAARRTSATSATASPGAPSGTSAPVDRAAPAARARGLAGPAAPRTAAASRDETRELRAWADLVGAALVDNGLVEMFRDRFESALDGRGPRHDGLLLLLETLCALYDEEEEVLAQRPAHVPLPVDASRVASALGVALADLESSGEDTRGGDGADGDGFAGGAFGSGDAAGIGAARAARRAALESARGAAVRLERRAQVADDVRALAEGAHALLLELERERSAAEVLAAAARGADPELARLEAANRLFRTRSSSPKGGAADGRPTH